MRCFFQRVPRRIQESSEVPDVDKSLIPHLKRCWHESSQLYSHLVSLDSIRTHVKRGKISFEPKVATNEFRDTRINTIRNMIMNITSILIGAFQYSDVVQKRKSDFPEALDIIKRYNDQFTNEDWKKEKTN